MISEAHNFLFVHIQKTGGNSIQNVLKEYSEDRIVCSEGHHDGFHRFGVESKLYGTGKHSRLADYKRALPSALYQRLFKFTVVRNPWDRAVSYFAFRGEGGDNEASENDHINHEAFREFVRRMTSVPHFVCTQPRVQRYFRNSRPIDRLLSNPLSSADIDFYLRFENLQRDFATLCGLLNLDVEPLPRSNPSKHIHYSTYYDAESFRLVRDKFRHEIEYFGYRFESDGQS